MYDLSIITDAIRQIIINALASSPLFGGLPPGFSVAVSGQHPQQPPTTSDCDLNLYLFHLTENKYLKNSFWTQASITNQPPGPKRQPVAYEPLCLDLFFLLTAQSQTSYVHEQQVMSVAMRALHEYGTLRLTTPRWDGEYAFSEVSISLESPTWDELSRLWQALTVPLRMTAQYRVGVAMLMPELGLVDQPHPTKWTLLGGPSASDPSVPVLFGTSRHVTFTAPVTGDREYDQTPAAAAPAPTAIVGQEFMLRGLNILDTCPVYLVTYTGGTETETDISAWRQPLTTPYIAAPIDGIPFLLRPPAPPAVCPPPGRYGLRIGAVTDPSWRSATVPFLIAPWLDPTGGPLSTAGGGIFTVATANIPAAGAELRLGTTPLNRITSGAPAAGEWLLTGATLTFAAPSGMAPGQYAIRLRAADVESDPSLWAVVT